MFFIAVGISTAILATMVGFALSAIRVSKFWFYFLSILTPLAVNFGALSFAAGGRTGGKSENLVFLFLITAAGSCPVAAIVSVLMQRVRE